MEENKKIPFSLWKLFWANFVISGCTFGGGFVIITFMKKKYADELHWLEEQEMLDMVAIGQSAPGVVAVNTSILVGWKLAGFKGMVVSVLGTVIPPMLIIGIISFLYAAFISNNYVQALMKGMQAGVAAVLVGVVYDLAKKTIVKKNILEICLLIAAAFAVMVFKVNVMYVIFASIIIGVVRRLIVEGGKK